MNRAEFDAIYARCEGPDALTYLTPDLTAAAAALVRSGRTVSCAWPLDTVRGPDNPDPVEHEMTLDFDDGRGLRIVGDRFRMEMHGDAHSHLDALNHVVFDGRGREPDVTAAGQGIVTRGVLVDLPRFRGVDWIEPGEAIGPDEFRAAEERTGTRLRRGDLLLFRTGHAYRRKAEGPWDAANAKAGLHPAVLPLLCERQIVGAGYDGDGETVPSPCPDVTYPIHAISLPAAGWWTMDSLDLDDLAAACVAEDRWEFLLTVAPLRIAGGTGSPVNPIAVF